MFDIKMCDIKTCDIKIFSPVFLALVAGLFAAFGFAISIPVEMLHDPVSMFWLVVDILAILAFLAAGIIMKKYASTLSILAYLASASLLALTVYAYSVGGHQVYWAYVNVVAPILLVVFAVKMIGQARSG